MMRETPSEADIERVATQKRMYSSSVMHGG
jgi:hypothetical protein